MTDMHQALREQLDRRQAEQQEWREALFGKAPPEPTKEPGIDALRREAAEARAAAEHAHREAGTTREEPEAGAESFARDVSAARPDPPVSFDGGVRETPPPEPPSMDSVIRGSIALKSKAVDEYARDLDYQNR